MNNINNLGDLFEKKLIKMGVKRQVEAALVCEAFDKTIAEVFGEKGTKNVKAISFRENVLKVGVTSSSWANEINMRQVELEQGTIRLRYERKNTNF